MKTFFASRLNKPSELVVYVLSALSILPLWWVSYPPIQDLPQHLAAIRIISEFHNPVYGFDRFFELHLSKTQYLGYYMLVAAVAKVLPLKVANLVVLSAAMFMTPLALGALLRAAGKDARLAVAFVPFSYHGLVILGFFNFVAALPLMLWGAALAIEHTIQPNSKRAWLIGGVTIVTFFMHVLPFTLLMAACLMVFADIDIKKAGKNALALAPGLIVALVWSRFSRAGADTQAALIINLRPAYRQIYAQIPLWLSGYFFPLTSTLLVIAGLLALNLFSSDADYETHRRNRLGRRLIPIALGCAIAVFVLPDGYKWIWPIAPRFIVLALLFACVALPNLRGFTTHVLWLSLCVLSIVSVANVQRAFQTFDQQEVRGFSQIIKRLPARPRVAGLIFARSSSQVAFSPFLHFAAYSMAQKGGAAMFSFADFPMSPYGFSEHDRPPRVPPRWEWTPESVNPVAELAWYDYVITRGGPGIIAQQGACYRLVADHRPWKLWERTDASCK